VDMTTKAISRKALRESLASCSVELKKQVNSHRLLKKNNLLVALDLSHLAVVARLSCMDRCSVAVVAVIGRFV
jgi:hypothetical protein